MRNLRACHCPPPSAITGGAFEFGSRRSLRTAMAMSVSLRASMKRTRPSSIHSAPYCVVPVEGSPKVQLPTRFGPYSRRRIGLRRRISGMRTSPWNSSGLSSIASCRHSACAIVGSFDHVALPNRKPPICTSGVQPKRSTSRLPVISNLRPVRASTWRSTSGLNQFQSQKISSNTIASANTPSAVHQGCRLIVSSRNALRCNGAIATPSRRRRGTAVNALRAIQ